MKMYSSPILILWLLLVCSLLGCKREDSALQPLAEKRPVSMEEARTWFDRQTTSPEGRRNGNLPERKPRWEAAERISLSNGAPALAVPLEYKSGGLGTGGLTKLLFFVRQGQLQSQIMKLVSDSVYFYRNKQYIELENFSGVLTMHNWQEQFLYGARYEQGKVTGELSAPKASGRIGPTCEMVTITHYVKVCVGSECETRIDYVEQYIDCGGGGGGDTPLPKAPIGGGGGGGTPKPGEPLPYTFLTPRGLIMPGQEREPIDLKRYLDCFGVISDNANYQITVYVEEPVTGSGWGKVVTNVGHVFIGMKKQYPGTDSYVQQVFGFYPRERSAEVFTNWVPSKFVNNGGSGYTVSVTYDVSAGQFQNAVHAAEGMIGKSYHLSGQNCTDAVFNITNAAGLPVPQNGAMLPWGGGFGHTPGQLGKDLQNSSSGQVNTSGGQAPLSLGPC